MDRKQCQIQGRAIWCMIDLRVKGGAQKLLVFCLILDSYNSYNSLSSKKSLCEYTKQLAELDISRLFS